MEMPRTSRSLKSQCKTNLALIKHLRPTLNSHIRLVGDLQARSQDAMLEIICNTLNQHANSNVLQSNAFKKIRQEILVFLTQPHQTLMMQLSVLIQELLSQHSLMLTMMFLLKFQLKLWTWMKTASQKDFFKSSFRIIRKRRMPRSSTCPHHSLKIMVKPTHMM